MKAGTAVLVTGGLAPDAAGDADASTVASINEVRPSDLEGVKVGSFTSSTERGSTEVADEGETTLCSATAPSCPP